MSDLAGVLVVVLIVVAGAICAVVAMVAVPAARLRAVTRQFQASGAIGRNSRDGWTVGAPADQLRAALLAAWTARGGAQPASVQDDRVLLPGNPLPYRNVNRIEPLDFSMAEVRCEPVSAAETRLTCRIQLAGFGRVVWIVGLCTVAGGVALGLGASGLDRILGLGTLLVVFGFIFLGARYMGQQMAGRLWIDELLLAVIRQVRRPVPPVIE